MKETKFVNKRVQAAVKSAHGSAIILGLIADGEKVSVGEYRLWEAGERGFMNQTSGKRDTFSGIWHTVEVGRKAYVIADRVEGADPLNFESPYEQGDIVAVCWQQTGYIKGKGERHAGLLVSLEEKKLPLSSDAPVNKGKQ